MNKLQLYATFYHSMGMNIAPIYGHEENPSSFKKPGVDISKWHKERQSVEDIMSFNWVDATGIGLITGFNGIRAIDIDGVKDDFLTDFFKYRFLGKLLEDLGLPVDYEWLVLSGSGNGCHIIFRNDDIPEMILDNYSFQPGSFSEGYKEYRYNAFDRFEISWNYFLVLPPSCSALKPNKESYGFWNWDVLPQKGPSYISNESLANTIFKWCADDQEYCINYNKIDCRLFCRECILGTGYGNPPQGITYYDCRGLFLQCDEGKNFLSVKQRLSLELLKSSKCNNARVNLVSLMAVGYIETSYTKVNKQLKELLHEGVLPIDEYDELEKLAQLNCRQPNRLMFFDTETNGLSPKYDPYLTNQPRIVQLSWLVADEDGDIEKKCGYLIKPVDFTISEESIKVHGITQEKALNEGILIKDAISLFLSDLNSCNALVGHNVSFDIQILRGELERLKIVNAIHEMPYYCTMRLSVDYCKIPTEAAYIRSFSQYLSYSLSHPREYKYKFPTLIELYDFLFDEKFDNAHDASADVEATAKCFFELAKRKVISYNSTDRTYGIIIVAKDRKTNVLNDSLLSCIEKWQLSRKGNDWSARAILHKNRIIKVPLLYKLSNDGVQIDALSLPIIESYGLALCESFSINPNSIAVSTMQFARIIPDEETFMISEVHWRDNEDNKWRTKLVRSFSIEERNSVENTEIVATQYGNSVCFKLKSGRETFIPLSNSSLLRTGESIDLSKGKLIGLCREGEDTIWRVIE